MTSFYSSLIDWKLPFLLVLVIVLIASVLSAILARKYVKYSSDRLYRKRSQAVVTGLVNEQFAPLFKGFPGRAADARFIGKPVDYIVFNGLSSKDRIDEVIFVEVKSHSGIGLTANERSIRDAIENKRVRWVQFNID